MLHQNLPVDAVTLPENAELVASAERRIESLPWTPSQVGAGIIPWG